MNKRIIKVLYVEDTESDFILFKNYLKLSKRIDFHIDWAKTYDEGIEMFDAKDYDACVLDYYLDLGKTGADFLSEVTKNHNGMVKPFIVLTYERNQDRDLFALKAGAMDYITKDFLIEDNGREVLERSIIYAIERKNLENDLRKNNSIQKLILDTSSSAICTIDLKNNKIINHNKKFSDMFELEEDLIFAGVFKELIAIKFYNTSIYKNDLSDQDFCDDSDLCSCTEKSMEVHVTSMTGVEIDCLMSCQKTTAYDDQEQVLRVITFTDMTNQKKIQNRLIETQEMYEQLLKKYALESKNPKVLIDLVNVEIDKFKAVENLNA